MGFRVEGLEFRVSDLGFQVLGSGFRVEGLGFTASCCSCRGWTECACQFVWSADRVRVRRGHTKQTTKEGVRERDSVCVCVCVCVCERERDRERERGLRVQGVYRVYDKPKPKGKRALPV